METRRYDLSPPSLDDIAAVWAAALPRNYTTSSATVVACPDLRFPPFGLAAAGLCGGSPVVADVGGQANLYPTPRRDKNYELPDLARRMQLDPACGLLIGAGAGPNRVHGINSELAPNLAWHGSLDDDHLQNLTRSIRVLPTDPDAPDGPPRVDCPLSNSAECALMVNLYGSRGQGGPVIRVTARGRHGRGPVAGSLTEFLRNALHDVYDDRQVSLGGVFVLRRGRARFHVMPDFPPASALPFPSRDALDRWLTYHDFSAPMTCLSVFHSADPRQLGLRMEHTHCFAAAQGTGGHYHYDLVGAGEEEVEYEGYFHVASTLVQIDRAPADWDE